MKILFATDGSPCSQFAEQLLSVFPFATSPQVEIAAVCPVGDLTFLGREVPSVVNEMIGKCRETGTTQLAEAKTRIEQWGEVTATTLLDGHPAHEILMLAEKTKPDLVVLGSHGYGPLKRLFLGSVSDRVATHCHTSVLIARPSAGHEGHASLENILVAYDGSDHVKAALKHLSGLSLNASHRVRLISVLEEIVAYGMEAYVELEEATTHHVERIEAEMKEALKKFAQCSPASDAVMVKGISASEEIIKAVDGMPADLVVVGSAGRTGVSRFLLGSIATQVLRRAHCSVWIDRSTL